jgi:hypothetical protein
MAEPYDRHSIEVSTRRATVVAWVIVALLAASMLVRAWLSIRMYGDPPRTWGYRTSPYIPAQTYSSTRPASTSTQVEGQVKLPAAAVSKRRAR